MISPEKIETAIGLCIVAVTKHLMKKFDISSDEAYAKLMSLEIFELIEDSESGMYLEPNEYLFECADIEINQGADALYNYLSII